MEKNTHFTLKTERSNIGMCFTVIIIFHSGLEFIKESADLQKKLNIVCLLFSAFCKQSAEYELIYGRDDEKNNTAISYTFKHLASYSLLQGFCV